MTNLKLLINISSSQFEEIFTDIYNKYKIGFCITTNAKGTASSSILNYFGIVETSRKVNLAIIPEYIENEILNEIKEKLNIKKHGTGISFTISLTSANKFLADSFTENKKEDVKMEDKKYHLVITIVSEGYLEQVMDAAKKAGVQGGTVIRGRGLGNKEAQKLFGFKLEPGRDLILNVVEDNIKNKVMEEITKEVGIKTSGKGICLSLPVDNAIGIIKNNTELDKK